MQELWIFWCVHFNIRLGVPDIYSSIKTSIIKPHTMKLKDLSLHP